MGQPWPRDTGQRAPSVPCRGRLAGCFRAHIHNPQIEQMDEEDEDDMDGRAQEAMRRRLARRHRTRIQFQIQVSHYQHACRLYRCRGYTRHVPYVYAHADACANSRAGDRDTSRRDMRGENNDTAGWREKEEKRRETWGNVGTMTQSVGSTESCVREREERRCNKLGMYSRRDRRGLQLHRRSQRSVLERGLDGAHRRSAAQSTSCFSSIHAARSNVRT